MEASTSVVATSQQPLESTEPSWEGEWPHQLGPVTSTLHSSEDEGVRGGEAEGALGGPAGGPGQPLRWPDPRVQRPSQAGGRHPSLGLFSLRGSPGSPHRATSSRTGGCSLSWRDLGLPGSCPGNLPKANTKGQMAEESAHCPSLGY